MTTRLQNVNDNTFGILKAACRLLRNAAWSSMLFLLCVTSANALDTDIYYDRSIGVQPNVVFYLDTSGSMLGRMNNTPEFYEPATVYSGPFDSNSLYYSLDGRIPASPSTVQSGAHSFLHCETARNHIYDRNWGFFSGRFIARMPNAVAGNTTAEDTWLPLSRGTWNPSAPHLIECHEDQNHSWGHGQAGTTFDAFPSPDRNNPWTTDRNRQIDWDPVEYSTVFTGNFINYKLNPPIGPPRNKLNVMQRIVAELGHRFPQINAGVASMNYVEGAAINFEVSDLRDAGWRHVFENTVEETVAQGATPLAEGLYEIYRYFRGERPHFGTAANGISVPRAVNSATGEYYSPVTHECQRNHVIMLTDGVPYHDASQAVIQSLPNFNSVTGVSGSCASGNNRSPDNSCLDDLAEYMSTVDLDPNLPNVFDDNNDGVNDGQTVKVHPVGVQIDFDLLQKTADRAGTQYYTAQNAIQLENDLMDLLSNLTRNESVASAITTSSDQFSRVSHRNEVFIGLYEPTSKFQWDGNIKKFRIAYDGTRPYLTDSDEINNPEVLTNDGSILNTAQSYWSSSVDGSDPLKGGFRERLANQNPASRKMYGRNTDVESNLSAPAHALSLSQGPVNSALGAFSRPATERQNILNMALGYDVKDGDFDGDTTDSRGRMGAMARNQPVVIQYGGTAANPDLVVFAATSDGLLHGIDGMTGDEIFAVAPLESVSHFVSQHDNPNSGKSRWWGMDGRLSAHVIDRNRDGTISRAAGDSAILYLSYGLGGRVVYSFDVTEANNRSAPKIVEVSKKHSALNARWSELGHTLSKPVPFRMRNNFGENNFMAFSMGYDPNAEFSYTGHTMGRGIAILTSGDGSQAWSGYSNSSPGTSDSSYSNMDFAFAAEPTPLDTNNDGFADRIYAVDLGAQVWRFDLEDPFVRRAGSSVSGGRIAALGRDSDGNRRRVFKPIQAAMVRNEGDQWVALVLGTGDRMNPLASPNDNRLYMLKDRDMVGTGSFSPYDNSDLFDATDNTLGSTTNQTLLAQQYEELRLADGWYVDLPSDRKAISTPLIAEGIVNYPVYNIPTSSNPCQHNIGDGTMYRMALFDAKPIHDYNRNSLLEADDREVPLKAPGIPPDLVAHRDPEGNLSICAGLECLPADPNVQPGDEVPKVFENYWYQH